MPEPRSLPDDGPAQPGADPGIRVVLVTLPGADAARAMARILVDEGLAACGSVVPGLTSIYRWEGEIREDAEALLLLKTDEATLPALIRRVPELHTYEVPEVLALPVTEGHAPYLDWVREAAGET
jgi:periplasmic divalent cation tolerance protein